MQLALTIDYMYVLDCQIKNTFFPRILNQIRPDVTIDTGLKVIAIYNYS